MHDNKMHTMYKSCRLNLVIRKYLINKMDNFNLYKCRNADVDTLLTLGGLIWLIKKACLRLATIQKNLAQNSGGYVGHFHTKLTKSCSLHPYRFESF